MKLHGSVGWSERNDRHLAFGSDFLQLLLGDEIEEVIFDADEGPYQHGRPLIVHPSYLKVVQNSFIREIWRRADDAIRSAQKMTFGATVCRKSDAAISLLLAPLSWRARKKEVAICVHDPNGEVRDRYRSFFDGHVSLDKRTLG